MPWKEILQSVLPAQKVYSIEQFKDEIAKRNLPTIRMEQHEPVKAPLAAMTERALMMPYGSLLSSEEREVYRLRTIFSTRGNGRRIKYVRELKNRSLSELNTIQDEEGLKSSNLLLHMREELRDSNVRIQVRTSKRATGRRKWVSLFDSKSSSKI